MEAVSIESGLDGVGDILSINDGSSVDERFAKLAGQVYSLKLENASLRNDIIDISVHVKLNAIREQILVYIHKFPSEFEKLREEYNEQVSAFADKVKEAPGSTFNEKVTYVVNELYAEGKLMHIFFLVIGAILSDVPGSLSGVISAFNTWYNNNIGNRKPGESVWDVLPRLNDLPDLILKAYEVYLDTQPKYVVGSPQDMGHSIELRECLKMFPFDESLVQADGGWSIIRPSP